MAAGTAGRRYAQAIFEIAKSENTIDTWSNDLAALEQVVNAPKIHDFLENPKNSRDAKQKIVTEFLEWKVQPVALKLALLLVSRERQTYISAVKREFDASVNKMRGIVVATVTTAQPIDAPETERIRTQLAKMTGKEVRVELEVNPAIIGGMVARIGDTLIDGSVATRLQNLRKQLV